MVRRGAFNVQRTLEKAQLRRRSEEEGYHPYSGGCFDNQRL